MKEIKFDEEYDKLERKTFFTIRNEKKGEEGEVFKVIIDGKNIGYAVLEGIEPSRLEHLSDEFLEIDTNTESREEAISSLKEHFPDLSVHSMFFVHFFTWISYRRLEEK